MVNRGVFVTGTDTGVGKTVAAACLVRAWQADYWKPLQTGLAEEAGDTATVAALSGAAPQNLHPPRWQLAAPLSPAAAARRERQTIALATVGELPATPRPLVVEGAGGLLVPINPDLLMVDLMVRLALPVVLVARTALGTINHTLLSLEALRARALAVAGVILSGPPDADNRQAIEHHGRVRVLAELPFLGRAPDAAAVAAWAATLPPLAAVARCASA